MSRLAIISSHPIQYNAPIFASLAKQVDLHVFYTWSQKSHDTYDHDFEIDVNWDIPFLDGYSYSFSTNTAKTPGSHHFYGINCPNLIKEIEAWGATHILVFGWNYKAHLNVMRHFKNKIPVWFRGDSTLLNESNYLKAIIRRLSLKSIYRYVDKALYVGKNNYDYFVKHGIKPNQLIYAPHAIDNNRFSEPNKDYEIKAKEWRDKLDIDPFDFVILYAGKFEPRKNLPFFLKAILEYIKESKNNKLKIILLGSGPQSSELKKICNDHPNIKFLPFQNQSQMPVVYRLADIFCLPSKSETWGLAINEAMACGRPVLVSDKVGCSVDLVTYNTGIVFKSNNEQSLKNSIKALIAKKMEYDPTQIKVHISNWSFDKLISQIVSQLND